MFGKKRNLKTYPPAKPNGDTNRRQVDIEIAIAREFSFEKNIVAFNVLGQSWSLPLRHECDMVVVSMKSRLLVEVEIKRTWADFCADFNKLHHHQSAEGIDIAGFWYCLPEGLYEKAIQKLEHELVFPTGIITYDENLVLRRHIALWSSFPEDEGKYIASTYRAAENYNLRCADVEKGMKSGKYFGLRLQKDADHIPTFLFRHNPKPLFSEQMLEVAHLGCMRQVSLREKLSRIEAETV